MTLVDLSPEMLRVSQELNPECTHIQGDMRTVRLGTEFEAVFIHDAICHMATREDLRQALQTAFAHCQPGGVALSRQIGHKSISVRPASTAGMTGGPGPAVL